MDCSAEKFWFGGFNGQDGEDEDEGDRDRKIIPRFGISHPLASHQIRIAGKKKL